VAVISELFEDARFILSGYGKIHKHQKELDRQAPKAGDLAPDFTLSDHRGENTVTLSNFRGDKPVALIFGSFT
jgi:peroxiredoxin